MNREILLGNYMLMQVQSCLFLQVHSFVCVHACVFMCLFAQLEVTLALLDAANDKDASVQEQVRKSILTLGNQQPDKVLSMCQDYLVKHSKVR